jgi:hypothetical protein
VRRISCWRTSARAPRRSQASEAGSAAEPEASAGVGVVRGDLQHAGRLAGPVDERCADLAVPLAERVAAHRVRGDETHGRR